ncbi:MAG: O-antigen ligase family protein [Caldilineaceae bacterium]|nr:O-antigen ligase family protein [Caldilineaceae bacterium]
MPSPLRLRLAWLRLILLWALGCGLALHAGMLARAMREHDQGPAGPQPAAPNLPFLGVTFVPGDLAPQQFAGEMERLADAGFGWVRVRLAWDAVEPAPGQWQWSMGDALVAAIRGAGLEPVLVLDGSPAWARAAQDQTGVQAALAPPADVTTFARFAAAAAERYAPQARVYQIWDEPNISPHWGARHIEAADYARLLRAASVAIRGADRDALILAAALAPTADRGHTAQDEVYFVQRLYAAGAAPFFDALALQPFGFGNPPQDPRQQLDVLNFRRAVLVRRAMVAAGDGVTPIWLVRTGWNRAYYSPWRTVSPQHQTQYALDALEFAYRQWSWVTAQGWAAHAPGAAPGDPLDGFSLTPDLAAAFTQWSQSTAQDARPAPAREPIAPLTASWVALSAMAALTAWRGVAAARLLPWRRLRCRYLALPSPARATIWAALLAVYWWTTWPPLIALCWVAAGLLIAAQPLVGLGLTLALLPFHAQHKEFHWVGAVWAVPPAYAALLCSLPALWASLPPFRSWSYSPFWPLRALRPLRFIVLSWGAIALLSMANVWHWPAYTNGVWELALVPLLLFALLRAWPLGRGRRHFLAGALTAGALAAALLGLASWLRGSGTPADGLLRLVGPTFSPNHTALYLVRSLFLGGGLALAAQGHVRRAWLAATAILALALLLTGSRGALLLGLPAGLITLAALRPAQLHSLQRTSRAWRVGGLLASIAVIAVLGWMLAPRLLNRASVSERWDVWVLTLTLWRDHWLTGVGPGGFYWRWPAYLSLNSPLDPNLRHPHMVWLEMAAQGGVLALVWLVVALFLGARRLLAHRTQLTWLQVGLAAGLVAGLAHGQVDAFQALPDLAAWNWAALALLLAPAENQPQRTQRPGREEILPK